MGQIKLQKRSNDFFVSYSHADQARAAALVGWLRVPCGLKLWFDDDTGNAAQRSSELLAEAIGNARGAIFLLSEHWMESSWCRSEFEVALNEQRGTRGFEIIAIRLDDVETPGWLTVAEVLDLRSDNSKARARLLRSLSSDIPRRFDNEQDVYLAAPWSQPSDGLRKVFGAMQQQGWRLVGDTSTSKEQDATRLQAIMGTTRGVVAIFPHVPAQPCATSPFILDEARLALRCGKPLLLLTEPGVTLPDELVAGAFERRTLGLGASPEALRTALEEFDAHLDYQPHDDTGAFIFFAGSLRGQPAEADDLDMVVQRASNMRCVRGQRLTGDNVQQGIIEVIRRAAVVIADVSDNHLNTLIEAGIAMGSGTRLKLIARKPEGEFPKKRFMFEGQEYHWYASEEERLGLCYWIARQFRRQVYVVR